MTAHGKNGSFSGILLKEPPKCKGNKQNNKRNSIVNISSQSKNQENKFDILKRPRTEVAVKGNTSFNIRNTYNCVRYSSMKCKQKYQQQLQNQLCQIKKENMGSRQFQNSQKILDSGNSAQTVDTKSEIFSLSLALHPGLQEEYQSEHQKQSIIERTQRIDFADKVEQMLTTQVKTYLYDSKKKNKKRVMLHKKHKNNPNFVEYFS